MPLVGVIAIPTDQLNPLAGEMKNRRAGPEGPTLLESNYLRPPCPPPPWKPPPP